MRDLKNFIEAEYPHGVRCRFFDKSEKCLELFIESRELFNDIKPILAGYEVVEKIKALHDHSEGLTVAILSFERE